MSGEEFSRGSGGSGKPIGQERPPTRIGGIEPRFEHPVLESSGTAVKATHTLLPDQPDQNQPTQVIEPLGRENYKFTLKGDCYADTATQLDALLGDEIRLVHYRHSGDVYVEDVSTSPQGVSDETGRRFTYTLNLIEVE